MKPFYPFRFLFLFVLLGAFSIETISQNFHLVKDINTSTNANPGNFNYRLFNDNTKRNVFAVLNGISYFSADDGLNGKGLWRSDGTKGGTYQVKEGVNPTNIVVIKNKLLFSGTGNPGLWISDGTGAGTVKVLENLPPGIQEFIPAGLTDFKGTLFFVITGAGYYNQLWKTDGTSSGTMLVKDFYTPGQNKSLTDLLNLMVIKSRLYFTARTSSFSSVLCVSDGTEAGTDIITENSVDPAQMIAVSSDANDPSVYFTAGASNSANRVLYVTTGDSGNAKIATGFNGIILDNHYSAAVAAKEGVIYFIGRADESTKSQSLYKFEVDGASGIQPVKIASGTNAAGGFSTVSVLFNIDGTLLFTLYDAPSNKYQLWKSDGTSEGNVLLKEGLHAGDVVKENGKLYFQGTDSLHGMELWITDGTANGTLLAKDINPGSSSSYPVQLTGLGGKLFFSADDGNHGIELWQSDGTSGGTTLLKDINQNSTASSYPGGLKAVGKTLIFSTIPYNSGNGYRIWKSDGTSSGTTIISDTINSGNFQSPDSYVIRDNQLYFFGNTISGRSGVFKTDIYSGESFMIKDLTGLRPSPDRILQTDSLVYFTLSGVSEGTEVWRTDGTSENTFIVKTYPGFFGNAVPFKETSLYFVGQNNNDLWKTDGTKNGTVIVKTLPGEPRNFSTFKGTLFFVVYQGGSSSLWKSDGTSEGTIKVTSDPYNPDNFIVSNGQLYFTASSSSGIYGDIGSELFKTDGTKEGTVLVKDIHPGAAPTTIHKSISSGGILYFFINATSSSGIELWKSDGTAEGTQIITTVGVKHSYIPPTELVTCNGKLFFVIGNVLWQSDGTNSGTNKIEDNTLSTLTIQPYNNRLTATSNKLFFTAFSYQYSDELYVGNISTESVVNYSSISDGNWNDPSIWADNKVPPEGASVSVRTKITANVNVTCNAISVEPAGELKVNPGVNVTILR